MNDIGNETSQGPQILVIGYGNPLRGDDGVGWAAAQALGEIVDPRRVECMGVHQLTPELSDPISRVDLVIFIDAADGVQSGLIQCTEVEPIPRGSARAVTHHMNPQGLLMMARTVFGRCPRGMLYTIGGEDFSHREGLSDTVQKACDQLVQQIMQTISSTELMA